MAALLFYQAFFLASPSIRAPPRREKGVGGPEEMFRSQKLTLPTRPRIMPPGRRAAKPMSNLNSIQLFAGAMVAFACGCAQPFTPPASNIPAGYMGQPFADARYQGGPQKIPGTVMCAYYDLGGEGVAYHDTTPKNLGSGRLNPLDGNYLNEFRHDEGVDTSYTKFGKSTKIDDNPFDLVTPPPNLLYVGWTEPGEWFNLTVDVAETGTYTADILYTSNRGAEISFDVNGKPIGPKVVLTSTANPADPIAWRQWHHWNLAKSAANFQLPKGKNLITVHIEKNGNINLATLDFHRVTQQ
jgi:hypothetical protein